MEEFRAFLQEIGENQGLLGNQQGAADLMAVVAGDSPVSTTVQVGDGTQDKKLY